MIHLKTLFLLAFITSHSIYGQFSLRIEIDGLKNDNGQIILDLKNERGESILNLNQSIENKKCIIVVKNLKPGKYGFSYFHDENKNRKMDTNFIGMPKEGLGYSNNAKGNFGPPDFENTIFIVKGDTTIKCTAIYL